MLNVMIVDDEPNVRQGIKMMIPWKELNLNVIAEAEDGDTGLKQILAYKPDITISDVKMPGMTGIQMISSARQEGFNGKFIILTGYSDFTYAKEAISLGVDDFILKPVDEDELINALKKISEKIISQRNDANTLKRSNEFINEEMIREFLVNDEIDPQNALKLGYTCNNYTVAILGCTKDEPVDEKTKLMESVKTFLNDFDNIDIVTLNFNSRLCIIFKGWERDNIMLTLSSLRDYTNRNIFVAIGDVAVTADDIKKAYLSSLELYKNKFLYLHLGIVSKEIIDENNSDFEGINDYASQIFAYMEINDLEKLNECLDSFQNSLRQKSYSQEKAKVICITILLDIKSRIAKTTGEKKALQFFTDNISNEIGEKNSLFDIICMIKKLLTEVSNLVFGSTTKSTMERIVQYIRNNYNQELRLELLANIFGYNSAYLGKVFHQYTGENFNNYLDEIRITEAKRLLSLEEYKVYEVAEMVGYSNINYFHNKFKKYVGISPLNFKKKNNSDIYSDNEEE